MILFLLLISLDLVILLYYYYYIILTHLQGTPGHIPLDWMVNSTYKAGPTTVWQLGVVLFEMLHMTRFNINTYISNNLTIWHWLSDGETNTCPFI